MLGKPDLDRAYAPLEPVAWPGGGEQAVRRLTWRQEVLLPALVSGDEAAVLETLPKLMVAILPGRSWDEIQDTLDTRTMRDLIAYASREYEDAMKRLDAAGNAVAGAAPASPPPTPDVPSSVESPVLTAAPSGMS